MIPGPTVVSNQVRKVMSDPQVGHSSEEFQESFIELLNLAKEVFRTKTGYPFILTGSGTVAMEAAVTSLIEEGDRSLVLDTGYFARRFGMILESHGMETDYLNFPFGTHADPSVLRRQLEENEYKAVFITHVDTSSTIMNSLPDLVSEVKKANVLSIVDSVCGIGGCPLEFDRLQADVVLGCSQKALAAPPGAALLMVSEEGMAQLEGRKTPIPSYYLNLKRWKDLMDDPRGYLATPAVQVMLALRESFKLIISEGMDERWRRHRRMAEAIRAGIEALGLEFLAEKGYRADTVTGFYVPAGKAESIRATMKHEYHVEILR
jgi:alanine-glyoxylate transaminase/serine-glyoxylate transaminase/serine-pyruvate transaminase